MVGRGDGFAYRRVLRNDRPGWFVLAVVAVLAILTALGQMPDGSGGAVVWVIVGLLGGFGYLMSSFTVEVDERRLSFYLSAGVFRKSFALKDVVSVRLEEINPLELGMSMAGMFGLRAGRGKLMYKLALGPVVRVQLADGSVLYIGDGEP